MVMGWQSCTDKGSFTNAILNALCREYGFDLDTPFKDYPKKIQDIILYGTGGHSVKVYYKGQRGEGVYDVAFPGLIRNVEQRYKETGSESMKQEYESFMQITPCKACKGQRLKKESLAVTVADKNIYEITNMSIDKLKRFLAEMQLSPQQQLIGKQILKGDQSQSGVPGRCRSGVSFPWKSHWNSFRRGGAEDPSGHTDWFRAGRSCLYSG